MGDGLKAPKEGSVGGAGVGAFLGWVLIAGVAVAVIVGAGWMVYGLFGHLGWALAAGAAITIVLGAGWMFLAGAAVNSSLEDLADQQAAEAVETASGPADEKNSPIRLIDPTSETRAGFEASGPGAQGDSGDRKDGPGPVSPHSGVAI
ncbi:MAG: hypothetical protein HY290_33725 [Planctomycetia bacterium]|nr:hypothetical protein [Planctomycetia bacterium]